MFKKENKKGSCSKTQENKNIKRNFFYDKKKTDRKDKHAKTKKHEKVPNQKVKSQKMQKIQILAFKRGHRQRKQERKRKTHGIEETTDEQMDEQKGGHKEVSRACKKG